MIYHWVNQFYSLDETLSIDNLKSASLRSEFKDNSSEIFFLPKREIIVSNTQDDKVNEHDILDIELGKQ